MTGLLNQLKYVAEDLNSLSSKWALIGALAVSVHAEPRTTRDIDVAIAVNLPEDLERIVSALLARGYSNPQVLVHVEPTHKLGVRLQVRDSGEIPVVVDLLSRSSGIEDEIVQGAESVEVFPGLLMPVACRGHLIAMKVLSMNDAERIRDKGDLQMLLRGANKHDFLVAETSVALMSNRGFGRGKDLESALAEAIKAFAAKPKSPGRKS